MTLPRVGANVGASNMPRDSVTRLLRRPGSFKAYEVNRHTSAPF